MQCEQAQQLFDAYLDGELSAPLATELGAHRLACADCRRALALLEVSGHIIASDREPVSLKSGFAERLLACMERPGKTWTRRLVRGFYIGGPLAAAAVVVLAFLGVFDPGDAQVAGRKFEVGVLHPDAGFQRPLPEPSENDFLDAPYRGGVTDERLRTWIEQARKNLAAKRQSGESLQEALDMTVLQLLDILQQAESASSGRDLLPPTDADDPRNSPQEPALTDNEDVEDL